MNQEDIDRFWSKIDKSGECWLWTAKSRSWNGYGFFSIKGKNIKAHRFSWEVANGPIPPGMKICHECDTPLCVRPTHLFLGTDGDNMADRDAKGRQVQGRMVNTAKLDEKTVLAIRATKGGPLSSRQVAAVYGISSSHVRNLWRENFYWKSLEQNQVADLK